MKTTYNIRTDVRFSPLELIDVKRIESETKDQWVNQTLCRVNDCVVRLGVLHGEFHWHKHDEEDEFFYVVDGRFFVDLEGRTVELAPQHGLQHRHGLGWPVQRQQDTGKIVVLPRVTRRQRVDRAAKCRYRVR